MEDCYSEIDSPIPGDIILYYTDEGDVEHSGIVVSEPVNEPVGIDDPNIHLIRLPMVVSKWGAWREVLHFANHCPYTFTDVKYYRVVK